MSIELLTGQCDQHIHWLSSNCGIHQQMLKHWQALCAAAKKDGFELTIASGFRNFDRQLSIWNRKFVGELSVKNRFNENVDILKLNDEQRIKAILTYSALPGASRHHWGTDIDVYAPNLLADEQQLQLEPWEYKKNGPFDKLSQWLKINAKAFGFYFPYDKFRGGIAEEPWHLSYFPLANKYQQQLTAALLATTLMDIELQGKETVVAQLDSIFSTYVTNIGHPDNG